MTLDELRELAKEKEIKGYSKLNKDDIIRLLEANDIDANDATAQEDKDEDKE